MKVADAMTIVSALLKGDGGATAIEYALVAVLIATAAIVAMTTLGANINGIFSAVASSV